MDMPNMGGGLTTTPAPMQTMPQQTQSAPSMHDGGPVATDGPYHLKAGSHVLTMAQAKMARKHALMSVGMKRGGMTQPAKTAKTPGEPTKLNAAHKKAEKKSTSDITVRPEKKQAAQIKDKTKK